MSGGNRSHIGSLLERTSSFAATSIRESIGYFFLFFLSYFFALSFGLFFTADHVSPIWLASGVGIAFLLIYGNKYWPSIVLASCLSNYIEDLSFVQILCITAANTVEALFGAWLIQYFFRKQNKYSTHSASNAIIFGVLIAAGVSACLGIAALYFTGALQSSEIIHNWVVWISANFLGGALLLPFLLSCYTEQPADRVSKLGLALYFAVGIPLGYFLFISTEGTPFLFLIFPYILWGIVILSDRSAKLWVLLFSLASIVFTQMEYGPFHFGNVTSNLFNLLIFLWGIAVSALFIADFKRVNALRSSAVFLLWGWFISGLVFFTCYSLEKDKIQSSFENSVDDALNDVHLKVKTHLTALRSGAALFSVSQRVERHEWKDFVRQLNLKEAGEGMLGIGVVYRVPRAEVDRFIRKSMLEQAPNFSIRPVPDANLVSTEAFIVAYAEPYDSNQRAVGLDFASESRRYNAATLATDTGGMTLSQSINLATDSRKNDAFLLFYPIYSHGPAPTTVNERRSRNVGWITAPILSKVFFANSMDEKSARDLSFRVIEPETGKTLANSADFYALSDYFNLTRELKIANRVYTMSFKPTATFVGNSIITASWAGISAALLTLLLSAFMAYTHLEKKRATQLVEERTEQLEMTGRMARLGGWEYEPTARKVVWSSYTREIHEVPDDYTPDADTALNFYKEGRSRNKLTEAFRACIKEGTPFDLEAEFVTAKGKNLWVRVIGHAYSENGKIMRVFGAFQDITQRLALENESRFIVESLKLGIWKYDPQTKALSWDKSMFGLYDVSPEDFSGHIADWEATLANECREIAIRDMALALEGKKDCDATFQIRTKAGALRHIGARAVVVRDEKGNAIHMYGINWDRTKEVELEQQLAQQRAKNLQAAKLVSLGEMSAGIAHEINNPLAIIDASAVLLSRYTRKPDKVAEISATIKKASDRINRIVSGLRRFSRSSEKTVYSDHCLSEIIRESIPLVAAKSKRSNTPVSFDLKSESYVHCNNFEIEQVIINLMNNAIDAVKDLDTKWVKVEDFDEPHHVVVRVSDSGTGITEEVRNKIFDPFYTTKDVGEGTGLGLSISKGILDDHKASISLYSNPHTCFEIRFEKVEVSHAT